MLAHEAWLSSRIGREDPPRGEAGFVAVLPAESPSAQYIAFDWREGVTLQTLLKSGTPMDVADVVAAAIAIARALGRLHRTGVIHRDVKPDNLLRSGDGRWWILDLGAALSGSDPPELRLLRAGTPSYMNPEQWGRDGRGPQPADEASDLYALGVTLYQWLTTRLPYGQVVPFQAGRFRNDPKPPSRLRPDVPVWLDSVVLRSVALDARLRFETAEELVLALERGAARPLATLAPTPLAARDPTALWKIALGDVGAAEPAADLLAAVPAPLRRFQRGCGPSGSGRSSRRRRPAVVDQLGVRRRRRCCGGRPRAAALLGPGPRPADLHPPSITIMAAARPAKATKPQK